MAILWFTLYLATLVMAVDAFTTTGLAATNHDVVVVYLRSSSTATTAQAQPSPRGRSLLIQRIGTTYRRNDARTSSSIVALHATAAELNERLDFDDRFDRWRFLARLLEDELDDDDTTDNTIANEVLFHALDIYLRHPRRKVVLDDSSSSLDETGSPERTDDRLQKVQHVMDTYADYSQQTLPLLSLRKKVYDPLNRMSNDDNDDDDDYYDTALLDHLQTLLPDAVDDEDDFKTTWDIVIELNGRESVKMNEQDDGRIWNSHCLMARLLIYYDFLIFGLEHEEEEHHGDDGDD